MKRYDFPAFARGVFMMDEYPAGVWVTYSDAKAEIERISEIYERRIRELKQLNWV